MKAADMDTRPGFPLMKQSDIVSFYHLQMPRWLFTESKYRNLSLEAKVAYTFLLNRFQLSKMNGWVNEAGEVFIVFTRESLAEEMQVSYRKSIDSFKELVKAGLIWEHRLGRGRPNQIYLAAVSLTEKESGSHSSAPFGNSSLDKAESRPAESAHLEVSTDNWETCGKPAAVPQEPQYPPVKKCGNGMFRPAKSAYPDLPESHPSYIDLSKKDLSKKEVSQSVIPREDDADNGQLQAIYGRSELWVLPEDARGVFRSAIERLFYSEQFRIGNAVLPRSKIRPHLWGINGEVLQDAYAKLRSNIGLKIKNSTAYVMAVLFNCVWESKSDLLVDPYLNWLEQRPARLSPGGDPVC